MVAQLSSPVKTGQRLLSGALSSTPSSAFGPDDIHLFKEGRHYRIYDKLGAHLEVVNGREGVRFSVWAPNAKEVSVIGAFNNWDKTQTLMTPIADTGCWEVFVPGVTANALYKFNVQSGATYFEAQKSDPFAFASEMRPATASRVWDMEAYQWQDEQWMQQRERHNAYDAPVSVYEVHLGSWMRVPEEGDRWLTYRELAERLSAYVKDLGFTHVELLPITEYPYDGSWGYQAVGYFCPTSRYGNPDDFKYFVDVMHQNGIGVILDWVPSHFPKDLHGLDFFDGTNLYEHSDWRLRDHKEWGTNAFNYGRWEVANFLIASALFWLDKYHIDGLRVDAVASMLYLDYSRKDGEWLPNAYGGRENIEAIYFLRRFNEEVYANFPDTMTFAEESTSFGGVSKPTYEYGLGFGYKWDMGWMHDTLKFMSRDSIYRKFHQNEITFRGLYMFSENFIMPLSHDEVVHGKGSILNKMPGDFWQKFANARLLYAYMFAQPGKKLNFMGNEIAQWDEWYFDTSLSWNLLDFEPHQGMQQLFRDLNRLYRTEAALHRKDCDSTTFHMVDCHDTDNNILIFNRKNNDDEQIVCIFNFTPTVQENYWVGVPEAGTYIELLNTDASVYFGSGQGNGGQVEARYGHCHGFEHHLELTLPPLGALFLKLKRW